MSRKNKRKRFNSSNKNHNLTTRELSKKIKSFQSNNNYIETSESTGTLSKENSINNNIIEDNKEDIFTQRTQSNIYYKEKLNEEKFNNIHSEIDNKTTVIEAKLSVEVANLKTLIEEKFSSFTKWGIGLSIAVIGIPITVFIVLINNSTDKMESKIELKFEKRILPIEQKINNIENRDSIATYTNYMSKSKNKLSKTKK